ncbi:trypsin-like peptidase domain-containing protein [Subtercola sp. YIM 133946]|uniref:trypsin-like peptidase domain-containing protein n=1 Tax=Subtercola sp. YIM 133946 TaxID=3118909 RepID=UPI002F92A40F
MRTNSLPPSAERRGRGHRRWAAAASVLAITGASMAVGAVGATAANADTAADLSQEHIAAIGEAGTVYLGGTWTGFVNYPTIDGSGGWSDQVDANFSCSGFVASPDGYIVTAGHCADAAEGKKAIVDQFLADEVANGDITSDDETTFLNAGAEEGWPVEGAAAGSPPTLAMTVVPAVSVSNDNASGYSAVLVDDRPLSQGDTALFKIDTTSPLPVLVVSTTQPATGETVDAIGYPGNVTDLVSGNPQPTFSQGQVSGRQQTDGGPFTQIGVTMSPGMSGGPVVNGQGDVIGTVSFGPSNDTQQLNFAAAQDTIAAMLSRNGVNNTLSDIDQSYRKGLDEYFSGQYHAAAADLGAVVTRQPNNAIAQQYQSKAIVAFPQENTTGWVIWVILGAILLFVIIVALVLLFVLLGVRRRRRQRAADAGGAAAPNAGPYPPGPQPVPAGYAAAAPAAEGGAYAAAAPDYGTAPTAAPEPSYAPPSSATPISDPATQSAPPAEPAPASSAPPSAPPFVPAAAPAPASVAEVQPSSLTPEATLESPATAVTPPPPPEPPAPVATGFKATPVAEPPAQAASAAAPPAAAQPAAAPPAAAPPAAAHPAAAQPAAAQPAAAQPAAPAVLYCSNCGAANKPDSHFCSTCGHALGG